ncbi:MAG: bifunctional indole-3-glycerol phosphate synthase/phosphoribosylanthranilate isomerase, partial [bacterium]
HPDLAVLRKDFLTDPEEIEVSHRAGADAVLLITAIMDRDRLARMLQEADRLGIAALVEVHTREEVERVAPLQPRLLGINSRNLETFQVDRAVPFQVAAAVDWEPTLVYESGIAYPEDVRLARESGFRAVLVGETAVAHPERLPALAAAAGEPATRRRGAQAPVTARGRRPGLPAPTRFWTRLYAGSARPLVKVCGITNRADAECAVEAGADVLGFILAPSPRQVDSALLESLRDLPVLKVGVVVAGKDKPGVPPELRALLAEGVLDAVQLHGAEEPEECAKLAFPYYKALRVKDAAAVERIRQYRSPRVLIDAFDEEADGGTGKRINADLVDAAARLQPLWLAGGLSPANVAEIVDRRRPELVDASSGLEASPGTKDHGAVREFVAAARGAGSQGTPRDAAARVTGAQGALVREAAAPESAARQASTRE